MQSTVKVVSIASACVLGVASFVALAQPATGTKPAQPAAPAKPSEAPKLAVPAKPAEAPQPGGAPDMQAMMEAFEKAATPGPMHAHLMKGVGEWDGKVTMWMMPGMPPTESTCVTVISGMMDGRFTRSETKGQMNMGGPAPMPFEGFGIYGYNNTDKKFEAVWCDNMGTMMMILTGDLSADGKVLTWNAKFTDPMTGQPTWMREVETVTGPNSMKLEMFGPGMDGKETKMMQIEYTRRAPSKPATK